MADLIGLIEIGKEDLPKCAVCGNREVVKGYMEKKGNKLKLSYYCHGEEDIQERIVGGEIPEVAFAPAKEKAKSKAEPKGKAK